MSPANRRCDVGGPRIRRAAAVRLDHDVADDVVSDGALDDSGGFDRLRYGPATVTMISWCCDGTVCYRGGCCDDVPPTAERIYLHARVTVFRNFFRTIIACSVHVLLKKSLSSRNVTRRVRGMDAEKRACKTAGRSGTLRSQQQQQQIQ